MCNNKEITLTLIIINERPQQNGPLPDPSHELSVDLITQNNVHYNGWAPTKSLQGGEAET